MDLPIKHEAFVGRGLAVRTAGFFKGPRLIIDGGEVKGKRLRFSLRDNSSQALAFFVAALVVQLLIGPRAKASIW